MQTTKLRVTWAKLNSFLVANRTLVDSGHILPAQELLVELTSAQEEFTAELSKLLEELETEESSRTLKEVARKDAVKEKSNTCTSKPEVKNEEVIEEEEEEEEEEEDDADCSDCDETIDGEKQGTR